jgi:hypothetical protein
METLSVRIVFVLEPSNLPPRSFLFVSATLPCACNLALVLPPSFFLCLVLYAPFPADRWALL